MKCVRSSFRGEFLRWCVTHVGCGERIMRARWMADEMGEKDSRMLGRFLAMTLADGGVLGCYKVERWNNRTASRNIAVWRVSYVYPDARGALKDGSLSIPFTRDEPSLHPARDIVDKSVGGVG